MDSSQRRLEEEAATFLVDFARRPLDHFCAMSRKIRALLHAAGKDAVRDVGKRQRKGKKSSATKS